MRSIVLLCVAADIAVPARAFAQATRSQKAQNPGQKKAPIRSAPIQTYASLELDRAIEKLPPNFNGHDIAIVYSALEERKKASEKTEFETTEQWHQRQETLRLTPIIGRMTMENKWAFVIHGVRSVYDADNQILQVQIPLYGMLTGGGATISIQSMSAKYESLKSSYMGTNAFGAVAEVESTRYTVHNVAFENWPSFPTATGEDPEHPGLSTLAIHASVSLGLDAAKQMKPELAVLAVCRLTAPFTRSYYFSDVATVSNPYASQYRTNYVMTELLEVWIYDRKSGVIHTKVTARH